MTNKAALGDIPAPPQRPCRPTRARCREEQLATFQLQAAAATAERTRVDWPLLLRGSVPPALPRAPEKSNADGLENVLKHSYELGHFTDLDALIRHAVRCLRDTFALGRTALFLTTADGTLRGTWGTDAEGRDACETHIEFAMGEAHREAFANAQAGAGHYLVLNDVPLMAQRLNATVVAGRGWNGLIPILGPDTSALGLVVCDNLLSQESVCPQSLMAAATFGLLLGVHLQRLLPDGAQAALSVCEFAGRVMTLLRADPDLDRRKLARHLGVGPGVLGKRFKAEVGKSITEYRNQLRVERFLKLVDPQGGNILGAALEAGFGSSAQFHRVFRSVTRVSPSEYLAAATARSS